MIRSINFTIRKSIALANPAEKIIKCKSACNGKSFSTSKFLINRSSKIGSIHSFSLKNQRRNFAVVTEPLESLGDSITTAVLLSWSKEPGDSVKEDDVIAVVETDKVTMEIRAKKNGVFLESLVAAGAEVTVGADIYKIDTSVQSVPISSEVTFSNATPASAAVSEVVPAATTSVPTSVEEVAVPSMGDSITQGILAKWMVSSGEFVSVDQVVATIETDKITVEVRSPHAGVLSNTFSGEGDEVLVGNPLFSVTVGGAASQPPSAVPVTAATLTPVVSSSAPKSAPASTHAPAAATPAAAAPSKAASPKPAAAKASVDVIPAGSRTETRVKMTRMRQRIAQRLKESQNTTAMLTTFQEVDMGNLIDLRNKHKEEFEKKHGLKLGFMSAFVKAATSALLEIPAVNGVIDDSTNEIVYRHYVDISVAVASPAGLVVPVLRNTEKMNFADVEKTIGAFSKKAKDGALALEDMVGGTFTISNGGVFGSLFGTPIINPPQSAILGMHATKLRAVVVNGKVEARPMMYLALTYDHRLIDGREAVTFLKSVANKIEDPNRLLLDL